MDRKDTRRWNMRQRYFEQGEKMSIIEEIMYDHKLNEDEMLVERTGYSIEFIQLAGWGIMLILAAICF